MSLTETEPLGPETGPAAAEPYVVPDIERLGSAEALTAGTQSSIVGDGSSQVN